MENALRGMRNPKKSWDRSDTMSAMIKLGDDTSDLIVADYWLKELGYGEDNQKMRDKINKSLIKNGTLRLSLFSQVADVCFIGPKDMKLAQRLIKAGSEHRKFMRQIFVSVDLTAPAYLWKQLDTYKINITSNSTSTMHTLKDESIELDRFEIDDYVPELTLSDSTIGEYVEKNLEFLENLRKTYMETNDIRYWKELIRWLPNGWLQTRTLTLTYENVFNIINQRDNHKVSEWKYLIDNCFMKLPYAEQFFKLKNII